MKQTVEEAAREYAKSLAQMDMEWGAPQNGTRHDTKLAVCAFKAGAEWYRNYLANIPWNEAMEEIAGVEPKMRKSPWTLVSDRSNPIPNDKPCLLLLEDGSVVEYSSDWEERCLMVVAWMPIPTFDQILEANKDVLQRMKEKGD